MVLSIVIIVADQRFQHMESVRTTLSMISYPLVYLAGMPAGTTSWLAEAFESRDQLSTRSDILRKENLTLRARLQQLEALEAENMRLRDLLGSSFKIGDRVLIA